MLNYIYTIMHIGGNKMKENGIAKTLQAIGIIEVVCGIMFGIIVLISCEDFSWVGIAVMIASFITCMLFVGFAEIINLLQKNADKQDALLSFLKDRPTKENFAPKSVLQDIESNLPKM